VIGKAVKHAALAAEVLADRDGKNEAAGKRLGKVASVIDLLQLACKCSIRSAIWPMVALFACKDATDLRVRPAFLWSFEMPEDAPE
jgi:hypothetical protein